MIEQFFRDPKAIQRMNEGPLGSYIKTYAKHLHDNGYSHQSSCYQLRLIASFSKWLQQQSSGAKDINNQKIDRYLKYRKKFLRINRGDQFALNKMLNMLHEMEITDDTVPDIAKNDYQRVEDDFKYYLSHERRLAPATIINYLPIVHKFLFERFGTDSIRFNELNAIYITGFVQRHAHDLSNKRAKLMVTAIRVFLRYLLLRKEIITDLSTCVPTVPNWKLSTVPKYLQPEQIQTILNHCNRQIPVGRRNYAILLLMARLALRACEVIALKLEDIEWESGYINIHGKGGSVIRFPLPQDVGEAIADYLKNGRPRCLTRHVFVCQHAPIREFGNSSTVSTIVRRALEQSGVDSPHKGAHLFRHTLATQMLRQGASLTEIGELLRHRSPNTTTIYAKVDITALKGLAQSWPGGDI